MTIRRGSVGSGITQKPTVGWNGAGDNTDPEIAALIETGTFDGLIASIERECFAIMQAAGLPTYHDCYAYLGDGTWHAPDAEHSFPEWGIANEIWPIAKARGISEDSLVGFASRMLGDVVWLRRARDKGEHDRVAQMAFYLGVKRAELRIKTEHEAMWQRGVDDKQVRVRGGEETRKGSDAERLTCYRRYRDQGLNKSDATDQAAQELGVSPATIRNARKGVAASD